MPRLASRVEGLGDCGRWSLLDADLSERPAQSAQPGRPVSGGGASAAIGYGPVERAVCAVPAVQVVHAVQAAPAVRTRDAWLPGLGGRVCR